MIVARCMKHIDHNKNVQLLEDMNSKNNQEESLGCAGYGGFYHANMIERLVLKVENGEMRPDVARVAIDGRKWIASRFHPNLLSEELIGNITHYEANIQDQHLVAFKSIVEKRKRQFKEEEKAKQAEERLELR